MSLQLVADYDSDADEQLRKSTFADPEVSDSEDDDDDDGDGELEAGAEANPVSTSKEFSRLPSQGTARQSSMQQQRRVRQEKGITGLPTASFLFKEVQMPVRAMWPLLFYSNLAAFVPSQVMTPYCKVLCSCSCYPGSRASSVLNVCRSEANIGTQNCSIGGHGPAGGRSFGESRCSERGQRFWSSRQATGQPVQHRRECDDRQCRWAHSALWSGGRRMH